MKDEIQDRDIEKTLWYFHKGEIRVSIKINKYSSLYSIFSLQPFIIKNVKEIFRHFFLKIRQESSEICVNFFSDISQGFSYF